MIYWKNSRMLFYASVITVITRSRCCFRADIFHSMLYLLQSDVVFNYIYRSSGQFYHYCTAVGEIPNKSHHYKCGYEFPQLGCTFPRNYIMH